jgi:hypothetical protein
LDEYVHRIDLPDKTITFTWVGHVDVEPARVYALAFTAGGEMLLVSGGPNDPLRWLPGGGRAARPRGAGIGIRSPCRG